MEVVLVVVEGLRAGVVVVVVAVVMEVELEVVLGFLEERGMVVEWEIRRFWEAGREDGGGEGESMVMRWQEGRG